MATAESLNISMTSASGKKQSRAITNISPNATTNELNTFAQNLVGLTTNTLVSTSKITKEELNYDYTPTFNVATLLPSQSYVTKVDNWTWNVTISSMPTTAEGAVDNPIDIGYKINNVVQTGIELYSKATMTFLPQNNDKTTPWITTAYSSDGTNINALSIFMFNDQEIGEMITGTTLKIHFPATTYNNYSVAPTTVTFNFV